MFTLLLGSLIALTPTARAEAPRLADLAGTYRGFAPTDESALATGEIEIDIKPDVIAVRMATGLKIETDEMPTTEFEPMTAEEVAATYVAGSPIAARSFGFKGPGGHPRLVFLKDPKTNRVLPFFSEFGLIVVTGGLADLLGATALLSPAQLKKVSCERFLRSTELLRAGSWRGGLIPRLARAGLARRR